MYLVSYSEGEYDSYGTNPVFVTYNLKVAEDYIEKFDRTVTKLRKFYEQRREELYHKDEFRNDFYTFSDRAYKYRTINYAFWETIEVR